MCALVETRAHKLVDVYACACVDAEQPAREKEKQKASGATTKRSDRDEISDKVEESRSAGKLTDFAMLLRTLSLVVA